MVSVGRDGRCTSNTTSHREDANTADICGLLPPMGIGGVVARTETVEGAVDLGLSKEMEFFFW